MTLLAVLKHDKIVLDWRKEQNTRAAVRVAVAEKLDQLPEKFTRQLYAEKCEVVLLPTGECWCGCERQVPVGSFFAQGHDKVAESAVILTTWGGVPEFMMAHGFGPGGQNARKTLDEWRANGHSPR